MPARTLDLNGCWQLLDTPHGGGDPLKLDRGDGDWLPVAVPGDIHPALQAAGRIPDPFWSLNCEECEWTGRRDWWHRRAFKVPRGFRGSRYDIVLDGVDTYATVYVNGVEVGETANMFRQYRFDITPHLRPGETNTVLIRVKATLEIIEVRDVSKYFACFYTPRIFARKAQCQFSWDWAPKLPGLGIWRGVRIEAISSGRIEDVCIRTRISGAIHVQVMLDPPAKSRRAAEGLLRVEFLDGDTVVAAQDVAADQRQTFLNLRISRPRLWWPNGYGAPHLYTYRVTLLRNGKVLDEQTGRFGLREVELLQESDGVQRQTFRFRVNGVDVFALGANWVPADCFTGTVDAPRYEHLVRLAKEAHFNMLRVWGGGIYEQDAFYDYCDEYGIMIWQDLMFACSDIPDDDPDFTLSVVPEFEYQVRRLRNHPCIAHWCGGNEKTGAVGLQKGHGDTITHYLGRGVVQHLMPDAAYTYSSPFSLMDNGNQGDSGDTHGSMYEASFVAGIRGFRSRFEEKKAVFMSEFGLFGPCCLRSLKKFIPEDKLWPLNEVWEEHIHDNPYNDLEETFVQVQEKCATTLFHEPESAADFVKVAGAFHAEHLGEEFEHHRRRKPENAGAMVWMFNDVWPAASWSIIDYYGVPKPVYHRLRRASAPVLLSFRQMEGGYDLHVVSDLQRPLEGTLRVTEMDVEGRRGFTRRKKLRVAPGGSARVLHVAEKDLEGLANGYLHAVYDFGDTPAETIFFHHLWHDIAWPDPGLTMRVTPLRKKGGEYTCTVTLKTENFARFVNLGTAEDMNTYMSDNFFDMVPGAVKRVTITAKTPFDPKGLRLDHWLTPWE